MLWRVLRNTQIVTTSCISQMLLRRRVRTYSAGPTHQDQGLAHLLHLQVKCRRSADPQVLGSFRGRQQLWASVSHRTRGSPRGLANLHRWGRLRGLESPRDLVNLQRPARKLRHLDSPVLRGLASHRHLRSQGALASVSHHSPAKEVIPLPSQGNKAGLVNLHIKPQAVASVSHRHRRRMMASANRHRMVPSVNLRSQVASVSLRSRAVSDNLLSQHSKALLAILREALTTHDLRRASASPRYRQASVNHQHHHPLASHRHRFGPTPLEAHPQMVALPSQHRHSHNPPNPAASLNPLLPHK